MIVDGRDIAQTVFAALAETVAAYAPKPVLGVVACAPTPESQKYIRMKQQRADELGVTFALRTLPDTATTGDMVHAIHEAVLVSHGVLVQLPLPEHIDTATVVQAVPTTHDVDAFHLQDAAVLPPVAAAMREVLLHHGVSIMGKRATVVGAGRLVGQPAARWLRAAGALVTVVEKPVADLHTYTAAADIVVLGAGVPGLLQPDMVREGVVILDGGTTEDGGALTGDADPACAAKASLFTPVPGGIGPITVAVLYKNLIQLYQRQV
ncbi:MAG: bifunctional 5,10-methylenetetrahydrofolate dehydrogenase/5,10-methenyltetrahydrofolate cyclohydrolase [Candidatus Pacebacteria bacterium]|nr:bifunctional 5,10-methylenetetrahydrofolate dehydrogenase/5,10-methenyltetrahydrofolate cyclohydrolase [Candidatus Paceibacterota bacterium]